MAQELSAVRNADHNRLEKQFISIVDIVSEVISGLHTRNNEQLFLLEFFHAKLKQTGVSKDDKLYIYIMLLYHFKSKVIKLVLQSQKLEKSTKQRWERFCSNNGLKRLITHHMDFETSPIELVNETFLLWITQ